MTRPLPEITRRKPRFGRCRICKRFTRLTKEHVPPKKAFNDSNFRQHYVEDLDTGKVGWRFKDENTSGIYLFSLCDKCNNRTGTIYGADYINFVQSFRSTAILENVNKIVDVKINDFFPVRIIKQVASLILSTGKPSSFGRHEFVGSPKASKQSLKGIQIDFPDINELRKIYEELRIFVRRRDLRGLPSPLRLFAFGSVARVGFRTGIFAHINLNSKKVMWAITVGLYPIHWVLVLSGEPDKYLLEVTNWGNFEYKQRRSLEIKMPFYWLAGKYPLDFRTPQELNEGHFLNSMRFEGFVPTEGSARERELEEAVLFARTLGSQSKEGYLLTKFSSGIYYEAPGINGWLRDSSVGQVMELISWRLRSEKK
jgi:hypothetical protein